MLSLNTVMIHSENPARLVEVYRKVLGEPGFEGSGYTGWKAGAGFFMVGAHSEVKGPNEMPGRIIVNFETPDVRGEFTRLTGTGMTVVADPYQPGRAPGTCGSRRSPTRTGTSSSSLHRCLRSRSRL
ncbi:MAG: VOC family protein [Mycobacteriales bacterium]